ncbi:MAG: oxidoreductase, partial [Geobacteraceae bacterium]
MIEATKFKALVVEKTDDGRFVQQIRERCLDELPPGDLVVRVKYSSLNYKDALSATGNPGVTRNYPHTPGIDAAGEVLSCESTAFA